MSESKNIESLALQTACIKAYMELMIPCLEAMVKALDGLLKDLLEEIGGKDD